MPQVEVDGVMIGYEAIDPTPQGHLRFEAEEVAITVTVPACAECDPGEAIATATRFGQLLAEIPVPQE